MLLPKVISRLTATGETVKMLRNPPLVAGHRYLIENLRKGTFSGTCVAVEDGHVTFDLDRGERLTMPRAGNVWKDITGDEPAGVLPERVADLTGHGPGY